MLATVDYAGRGYDGLMGWIQVVSVEERDPLSAWAATDLYPMHRGSGTPFVTFGHVPSMFDAPGPNPPRSNERWIAETFLAVCPNGARSRSVAPIAGFRWGYELTSMGATPSPPDPTNEADWLRCRTTLVREFPTWTFAAGPLSVPDGERLG